MALKHRWYFKACNHGMVSFLMVPKQLMIPLKLVTLCFCILLAQRSFAWIHYNLGIILQLLLLVPKETYEIIYDSPTIH